MTLRLLLLGLVGLEPRREEVEDREETEEEVDDDR